MRQGHHKGQTKKPECPARGAVGDSSVSWGWAVQALSGCQGFPYQDPLSLDLAVLEKVLPESYTRRVSVVFIFLLGEVITVKGTLMRGSGLSGQE